MAGIENLNQARVTQYLNNSDVRTALEKKGLKLTEKSVFKIEGNKVQIDIEGDGVYDKTVSGLFKKDGSVNTNNKKMDVDDTAVNTSYIKQQNHALEQMQGLIDGYEQKLTSIEASIDVTKNYKFDEAGKRAEFESQKAKIQAEIQKAQDELRTIDEDYKNNHGDWTSKECKGHSKKRSEIQNKISQLQNEFNQFNVEDRLSEARQKFEQRRAGLLEFWQGQKQEIAKAKVKQEQKLHNAQHAYNDFLNKNGYETVEARNSVKDLKRDANSPLEAGIALGQAETTESTVVRLATEMFKRQNPDVKDFNVKYDAQTGAVSISLKDGDSIADYTISGFYDPEKKTLNFDESKLNLSENANSTRNIARANNTLNSLEASADKIDYALNPDKAKQAYGRIDNFKLQMQNVGISLGDIEEFRKQHKAE